MSLRDYPSAASRRSFLEKELSVTLSHIGSHTLSEAAVRAKNCENLIGAAQVPVGIAGPLLLNDKSGRRKTYYLPLATTEGALVASVSRGCKAITVSGNAISVVQRVGVTRGPVFKVKDSFEVMKLQGFVKRYFETLKKEAASTSEHLTLTQCNIVPAGPYVFIRFYFDTQDAMGMNMATIATDKMVARIERETHIPCIAVAGNFDIDKKPAWLNAIGMRGWTVRSEVLLSADVVKRILRTTPEKFYDVWLAKCMVGSALSGSMGFNAQFANVIAALFIATGQDAAHVVEGSVGMTIVEVRKKEVYVAVHLPSLMVGTVGGGTELATQQEALQLMGVAGTGKVAEFASVVGGAVLAGEISLLASLAEGSLAHAHEILARGNPKSEIRNSK